MHVGERDENGASWFITDELFDRVQEVRGWRTRVVKPGPPSDEYLLRKLLRCERCGARMHGTEGSRPRVRRYMCSTRRYGHSCGEPIVKAEVLEGQLVDWIRDFQPDGQLLEMMLATLHAADERQAESPGQRRSELLGQLPRLQDLYVLGDLSKAQYTMRRQAIEEELQRLGPPSNPAIDRAKDILADFARFWDVETEAAERRKLLLSLFEQVYAQDGQIVAVQPHDVFLPYFQALDNQTKSIGAESGSDGGFTRNRARHPCLPSQAQTSLRCLNPTSQSGSASPAHPASPKRPDPRRALGRLGEEMACAHLERRGFAILDRNSRTRHGEIDVVAFDGSVLAFVEVKTRRMYARTGSASVSETEPGKTNSSTPDIETRELPAPLESLRPRQRARLRRLATAWLQEHSLPMRAAEIRFDAIGVVVDRHDRLVRLDHLAGAW